MPNPSDLALGQVWTYRDAPSSCSRVVIGRVDDVGAGRLVVSVAVTEVPIPTTSAPSQTITHMPFERDALVASLGKREALVAVPDGFEEGYAVWRAAFDRGKAGAFTLSVADAVESIRATVLSPASERPAS